MMFRVETLALFSLILACVPVNGGETSETDGSSSTAASAAEDSSDGAAMTTTGPSSTSGSTADTTSSADTDTDDDTDDDDTSGTIATTTSEVDFEPICGDGEINGDEECDDGLANSDTAACTSICKLAFCGDGLIQTGKEACDRELKNGDGSYGGCTDLCQLGPHCGDKIHQVDHEECDALDPELADGSRCIACTWEANLMFVSSSTFMGDLGGVDGADSECQELAAAAKLPDPDTFRAWLSDGVKSPQSRFSPPSGAFILTNGALVATSWADLISGGDLDNAINLDESKTSSGPLPRAWSNTFPEGLSLGGPDCDGWTNDNLGAKGSFGKTENVDATWTEAGTEWCYQLHRIYCVATAG